MPILVFDEKTNTLVVRCKADESFQTTEEVRLLADEARGIAEDQNKLVQRLNTLLHKCHDWNCANDEVFKKNLMKKQQSGKTGGKKQRPKSGKK